MSAVVELLYSRRVPQVAVLALISFSFAGCSADMSSRLSQSNFSNPFASESTGSVQQAPPPQRELPQYARPQTQPGYYQSQPLPPPAVSAPQTYPVGSGGGVSGGGRGVSSYAPPAQPHLETTATVPPPAPPSFRGTYLATGVCRMASSKLRGELQSELTALFVPAGATRRGLVGWSGCAGGV